MRKIILDFAGRSYKTSRHKGLYETVATKFNVSPNLVYLMAHGKKAKNHLEQKIVRELYYEKVFENVGLGI